MQLTKLLKSLNIEHNLTKDFDIKALKQNSQECGKGDLFIALKGIKNHGVDYFQHVIDNGEGICLTSKISDKYPNNTQIYIKNLENYISKIIEIFYEKNNISNLVAVTGTNGKTSIVELIYQIASRLKFSCNSLIVSNLVAYLLLLIFFSGYLTK